MKRMANQSQNYSLKSQNTPGCLQDPQTWFTCQICLLSLTLSIQNSTASVNLPNKNICKLLPLEWPSKSSVVLLSCQFSAVIWWQGYFHFKGYHPFNCQISAIIGATNRILFLKWVNIFTCCEWMKLPW